MSLPDPGFELMSLTSPALAGRFFTTSVTWEALRAFEGKNESEVSQSCPTLCDPMDCSLPGSSVHGIPGKNTGVGCHALLQGIFPTQGSNPYLLHLLVCWPVLYPLSHLGSPLRLVFLSIALNSIFMIPSLHYLSCIHPSMPNLSTSLSIRHLFSSSEMATFDHLPALCKSFQS